MQSWPVPDIQLSRRQLLRLSAAVPLAAALPVLAACGASGGRGSKGGPAPIGPGRLQSLQVDVPRQRVTLASAPDLDQVIDGLRHFATGLYGRTVTPGKNWTASPLSMDLAFGMLRAGARGRTATQIDRVFGFPVSGNPAGSIHSALNALSAQLVTVGPVAVDPSAPPISPTDAKPVVAIANDIFIADTFVGEVARPFLTLLASQYGAHPDLVSFASGQAEKVINQWVTDQTRGRITKLFDQLDPSTLVVLANAVYFKADWASPFEAGRTRPGSFTTASGRAVEVPLMQQTLEPVSYLETADYQRIDLPYLGSQLTMRVLLPKATGPTALAGALAAAVAKSPKLDTAIVDLVLPKWKTATDIDLRTPLVRLGMPDAFSPTAADLSGIARGLFVDQAVHRATITVDEKGTEAAAVTGIGIASSAMAGGVVSMRVDRPFAWAIVHDRTGTPVFAGQVSDPSAG